MTIHLDSPEGCVRYRYTDLPGIAREAKEYGIGALQIIGWAWDGQDGAEPWQGTNPRLGTRDEFKEVIREIEGMGIRVLLMCKFKWADRSAKGFEKELLPYTLKDMFGNPVYFDGYGYQTMSQFMAGGSRRVGAGMCHLSEGFRNIALHEFKKILDLEPSGILYDELSNHMLLCFDTTHGHKSGESNFKGSLMLAEEFYNAAREANVQFLMAGEGPNDYLSQFYPINYIRTWDGSSHGEPIHIPAWKCMNPDMKFATCISGWDDREMVNQCLVYGYIMNYEPYHFKGRLSNFPDTVEYGQNAQQIRRRLRDYIWLGKFMHVKGVNVESIGPDTEYMYSVYKHSSNGKKAIVIANQGHEEELIVMVTIPGSPNKYLIHEPGLEKETHSDGPVTVPPRSLVVLVQH
jgi:hypothetical protein